MFEESIWTNRRITKLNSARFVASAVLTIGAIGCAAQAESEFDNQADSPETTAQPPALHAGEVSSTGPVIEAEDSLNLLARIDLPNQRSVRFYETEPGSIMVLESGRIDQMVLKNPEERSWSAGERYEKLSGQRPPLALQQAITRASAATKRQEPRSPRDFEPAQTPSSAQEAMRSTQPAESIPTGVGVASQALSNDRTHESFVNRFCRSTARHTANWVWVTGSGATGQWNDLSVFDSAAIAVQGSIHYVAKKRPWYTWQNLAVIDIPQGWYQSVSIYDPGGIDFDAKASVDQADGDIYDCCTQGE